MLVFLGISLLSTVLSVPIQVEGVSYLDKLEHAFAYGVLVFSMLYGMYKSRRTVARIWPLVVITASFYGVLLEWVQYTFFPDRYFEWLDAIANVSGSLLGGLLFRLIFRG